LKINCRRRRGWTKRRSQYSDLGLQLLAVRSKRLRQLVAGEAAHRATRLGIAPLGWARRPARHLWRELPDVHAEMRAAIETCGADQIWAPASEGGNPDHDALNALAGLFADQVSVLEFAEYNFLGGRPQAQQFPQPRGDDQTIVLTPEEQRQKSALLRIYASERQNLGYVGLAHECWRRLGAYDYSLPPHPGVLWYARFQWVAFRHPRVDFTRPEEVSRAIVAYLDRQAPLHAGAPTSD
jgi:hypothetical protein